MRKECTVCTHIVICLGNVTAREQTGIAQNTGKLYFERIVKSLARPSR